MAQDSVAQGENIELKAAKSAHHCQLMICTTRWSRAERQEPLSLEMVIWTLHWLRLFIAEMWQKINCSISKELNNNLKSSSLHERLSWRNAALFIVFSNQQSAISTIKGSQYIDSQTFNAVQHVENRVRKDWCLTSALTWFQQARQIVQFYENRRKIL